MTCLFPKILHFYLVIILKRFPLLPVSRQDMLDLSHALNMLFGKLQSSKSSLPSQVLVCFKEFILLPFRSIAKAKEKELLDGYSLYVTKNVKPDQKQMKGIEVVFHRCLQHYYQLLI